MCSAFSEYMPSGTTVTTVGASLVGRSQDPFLSSFVSGGLSTFPPQRLLSSLNQVWDRDRGWDLFSTPYFP